VLRHAVFKVPFEPPNLAPRCGCVAQTASVRYSYIVVALNGLTACCYAADRVLYRSSGNSASCWRRIDRGYATVLLANQSDAVPCGAKEMMRWSTLYPCSSRPIWIRRHQHARFGISRSQMRIDSHHWQERIAERQFLLANRPSEAYFARLAT